MSSLPSLSTSTSTSTSTSHHPPPLSHRSRLTFTGSPLSRYNLYRKNNDHLISLLTSSNAKFLPFYRLSPLTIVPHHVNTSIHITSHNYHPQEKDHIRTSLAWFTRSQLASAGIHLPTSTSSHHITSISTSTSTATHDITVDDIVLLGLDEAQIPHYVISITPSTPQHLTAAITSLTNSISTSTSPSPSPSTLTWTDVRSLLSSITHMDAALLAHARSLLEWHNLSRYCGRCGYITHSIEGGVKRQCGEKRKKVGTDTTSTPVNPATGSTSKASANFIPTPSDGTGCGATLYPRTDSVVITLVISADHQRVLLGRKKEFPSGVYTCLAGFLEPGESIEEGVRREVLEETAVTVGPVSYFGAQPWPFLGGQLMIGCYGTATPDAVINLQCSDQELEDAQWFTHAEIESMIDTSLSLGWFANKPTPTTSSITSVSSSSTPSPVNNATSSSAKHFRIPPPFAIAHQLVANWAQHAPQTSTSSLPRPVL